MAADASTGAGCRPACSISCWQGRGGGRGAGTASRSPDGVVHRLHGGRSQGRCAGGRRSHQARGDGTGWQVGGAWCCPARTWRLGGQDHAGGLHAQFGPDLFGDDKAAGAAAACWAHADSGGRGSLAAYCTGDPADAATRLGPLAVHGAAAKVEGLIARAALAAGRTHWRPADLPSRTAFFVAPTVLADVDAGHGGGDATRSSVRCWGTDRLRRGGGRHRPRQRHRLRPGSRRVGDRSEAATLAVAHALRAGQVDINGARFNPAAPFGGFGNRASGARTGAVASRSSSSRVSIQLPAAFIRPSTEPLTMNFEQIIYTVDGQRRRRSR